MNLRFFRTLILFVFILQGCALYKTMEMSAVLSPEQQEGYQETITSQKKHFVSLAPYREYNPASSNTAFILFVKNCGDDPIDISTQNVSAEFFGNDPKWASRNIAVFSPDDLMNVLEFKQYSNKVAARSFVSTYDYYTYDAYGNVTGFRTATILEPGYHSAVDILHAVNSEMQMVEELVLHPQILQPGEDAGGLVVCDTRAMNSKVEGNFHLTVCVNGEQHEFTFSRKLDK